jgi:hypothetical protein
LRDYSRSLTTHGEESTVPDDLTAPSSKDSDVPEPLGLKTKKPPFRPKKRGVAKLNSHFKRNLPTYVVTIISLGLTIIIAIIIPVAFSLNSSAERTNEQIQTQKETIAKMQSEIDQINRDAQSDKSSLQTQLQDYALSIQELTLRIQFLERELQKNNP